MGRGLFSWALAAASARGDAACISLLSSSSSRSFTWLSAQPPPLAGVNLMQVWMGTAISALFWTGVARK